MKRIHRFEVEFLIDGKTEDSYKWTRGAELIKTIYDNLKLKWIIENFISYKDFLDCVRECGDGHNIIYCIDNKMDLNFKHWSYNRKK